MQSCSTFSDSTRLYETLIALRGFERPRPLPEAQTFQRFAVLIPTHNEERVIGPLLEGLKNQKYPRHCIDIYVACDACTDRTKDVALHYGTFVLERNDPEHPGKTHNVRWALSKIPLTEYDAIAMFDADNLAHLLFLPKMNDYLEAHPEAEVIQGYLETKNPNQSWITRMCALAYWYANRFWQPARTNWGMSATFGGTRFVIRTSCIRRLGWNLKSLTEDLELGTQVVLSGGRVHWNEWAIMYNEKPLYYRASHHQRTRRMQGHSFVLWHYGGKTPLEIPVHGASHISRLLPLPCNTVSIVLTTALLTLEAFGKGFYGSSPFLFHLHLWIPIALAQNAYQTILGPSLWEGRLTFCHFPYLVLYTAYGLS